MKFWSFAALDGVGDLDLVDLVSKDGIDKSGWAIVRVRSSKERSSSSDMLMMSGLFRRERAAKIGSGGWWDIFCFGFLYNFLLGRSKG